jgi:surface antigen
MTRSRLSVRPEPLNERLTVPGWRAAARHARMTLIGAAVVLALICGMNAPATAAVGSDRSCDAICAQSTVHHPGAAKTVSVRWRHYPYATQKNPGAIDRWGSTERQCTGYVVWALNTMGVRFGLLDRGRNGRTVGFMSARSWARAARRGGWTVSRTPVVGSVAQWNAHETSHWRIAGVREVATAGSDGHVAIVSKVFADGTVMLRQYNAGLPGRSYSTMRAKAPRYLYIGVR